MTALLSFLLLIPNQNEIQFNRDVRPILADACFQCHGTDQGKRKADLRLDLKDHAFAKREDGPLLVPGHPEKSILYQRIAAASARDRMPPRRATRKLTAKEIDTIRRWIKQGAKWEKHWAFLQPERPPLPKVKDSSRIRNAIDRFIQAKLETKLLSLSPEAEKTTLLRRVTLTLTGLPPTPAEVDAFLNDKSPNAYEKVVDRLLNSSRYGEHVAARWLDAARYADTNGYQSDGERSMWRYRDQVIEAFNHNMPFDRFTIEQIAGDMLPNATLNQKILSGFNRNHRGNGEGGVIPEEYAVEYVIDRVDTTATVWLGLTLACARCHDHKYDPIKQREMYQVYAYFNNVPERGKAVKFGNSPPMIKAPTRRQQEQLRHLDARLKSAEQYFSMLEPQIRRAQSKWERNAPANAGEKWVWDRSLLSRFAESVDCQSKGGIEKGNVANFGFRDKFTFSLWIKPRDVKKSVIISRLSSHAKSDGISLQLINGRIQFNLVKRWLDDSLRVETAQPVKPNEWTHLLATYDGSRVTDGIQIYLNGRLQKLKINLNDLNQSFETDAPFRIGGVKGKKDAFDGSIRDVRVYSAHHSAEEARLLSVSASIPMIRAVSDQTAKQKMKLRTYFLLEHAPDEMKKAYQSVHRLRAERVKLIERFPSTMVMQEMSKPRPAHVLIRGQYDKPGEKVTPGVPSILPGLQKGLPNNRLGFARWLVSSDNPLTARVTVNRYWQMLFGTGLVKTVEDFGTQGEWPSNPELLDWLATEFMRQKWNLKSLIRTIVTSHTFRQSSRVTAKLLEIDPKNRLLSRGPRLRLSAEAIRDQALFVSGLLVEEVGGPSVKLYQHTGLWKELSGKIYKPSQGAGLYRRSLYTFWKRTIVPPTMKTFDSSMRESCRVRQPRTNTPLQALALMNDTTFVEASRALAERAYREARGLNARLTHIFHLATGRKPSRRESLIISLGYRRHLNHYREHPKEAKKLIHTGASKPMKRVNPAELAALTTVAGLILNLDEVVTNE